MRIDPKPFVFDANDRAVLLTALQQRFHELQRGLNRLKDTEKFRGCLDDKARARRETLETEQARVEDLITTLKVGVTS